MAKGLREAHQKGVIHRDIKSANIMISENNHVKIMDFGLARLKNQTGVTKAGTTLGTAAYMSPEQTQGAAVDHRSDIWSLGVVLYEMVTGETPFKGDYEQAVIYSILNEKPEPVSSMRADVPPELDRIINKTLAKNPEERYQTAGHLMEDVKKLKEGSAPEVTLSKIETSPEITVKASRKSFIASAILAAAVLLVFYLFILKGQPGPAAPVIEPGGKPSLAVVYFENNSGDANLDNWRSAFSELLTSDLSQSKYIRVLRSDEIYGIFKRLNLMEAKRYSADDLKNVARNGGVNHILKGSYIKAGNNFKITAMLIDADTGDTISSLSVKAEGEKEIFAKVDELTREIKSELNISSSQIADDLDEEIGRITTNSSEALKYYIEGRKYHRSGEFLKSIQVMEKAVSIDPQFAMAYRSMAMSYSLRGYLSKRSELLNKALESSWRLSDKERYLIRGDYYDVSEKTYDKAINSFKQVLELYPGDNFANLKLGVVYYELGEWDKAIERFELCRKNKDPTVFPYLTLSMAYMVQGLFDKSEEVLKKYSSDFPGNVLTHFVLYRLYIYWRKYNLAREELDKAFLLAPDSFFNAWAKGDLYYFKEDFKNAETVYIKLRERGEANDVYLSAKGRGSLYLLQGKVNKAMNQTLKRIQLIPKTGLGIYWEAVSRQFYAYLFFKTGKFESALKEFNAVWNMTLQYENFDFKLKVQKDTLLWMGLTYLEMNLPERARQTAEKLKQLIENGMNKKSIAIYYFLMGGIEFKSNRAARAIDYFDKAIQRMPDRIIHLEDLEITASVVDYSARAYYKNGNLEKAIEAYEKILSLTYGRYDHGDIYAKSYYHLGKIYQEKGLKEKALKNYNKFIELWKECDPVFRPLVIDARKRVALVGK
jgi:tetratricopeptide (TPR) repeat protein